MARPVTLFTGQWADLPFETMCAKAAEFGYDGLELACWGDHFDVVQANRSAKYVKQRWEVLLDHGLSCYAVSAHLVGQAVCDLIDERHKSILPEEIWGDGEPEGVRKRAARRMIDTAKAARKFMDAKPKSDNPWGVKPAVVNGFTGSSIWHSLYAFPPTDQNYWDKGFKDFAKRFKPILDAFDKLNVNFALEVHPTEIAFDIASARRAIEAVGGHKRFGFNFDPSHLGYQGVDYVKFLRIFGKRIFHTHIKDAWWGHGDGTVGEAWAIRQRVRLYIERHGDNGVLTPEMELAKARFGYERWLEQEQDFRTKGVRGDTWVNLGPNNGAGRCVALAPHPTDIGTVLVGAAGGGVWRTRDGGQTWEPLTDGMPNLSIGAVAYAPSDPNVVYVGTGEGGFAVDFIAGIGLLRSDDGGDTWTLPTEVVASQFFHFSVDPRDPDVLLAATNEGLLRFGAVRYLAAVEADAEAMASLARLQPWDGPAASVAVYPLDPDAPRAWLAWSARPVGSADEALRGLAGADARGRPPLEIPGDLSPSEQRLLGALLAPGTSPGAVRPVLLEEPSPEQVELALELDRPAVLVLADAWDDAWRVWVDGERRSLLRVGGVFRGVLLAPGAAHAVFRYQPWSWSWGLRIAGLLLLAWALALLGRWAGWRRPSSAAARGPGAIDGRSAPREP